MGQPEVISSQKFWEIATIATFDTEAAVLHTARVSLRQAEIMRLTEKERGPSVGRRNRHQGITFR
jgi:hypothetical protein